MRSNLEVVLAWGEKVANALQVIVPAVRKLISIFGDEDDVVCIESDEG